MTSVLRRCTPPRPAPLGRCRSVTATFGLFLATSTAVAQTPQDTTSPRALKRLSVDELMNIEVTSVSKRPQKLTEVASAIQVITAEDIRRSGATNLPEALRLATNLQVAQANAHDWAITARGFNGAPIATSSLADKLLVMIDGRTIYTPLFGGVFWDVQNVPLEEIDRIEVISGPGGSLWGANAVNGVINIVTKRAQDSQGLYASATGGSFLKDDFSARYGGSMGSNLAFRVYGERTDHNTTDLSTGIDARDAWNMTQGGFRMDYAPSGTGTLTVQGDGYGGDEGVPTTTRVNGQNVLGRWTRTFSDNSDFRLQMYFDRTWRSIPTSQYADNLTTYDIDFQHHLPLGTRQSVLWGAGYRLMIDDERTSAQLSFSSLHRHMQLANGFVQDEVGLVPDLLKLTLGTKLEHNDFSGFELQPSVRMAWTPTTRHTAWAAVSRAVRSPSRLDADIIAPGVRGDENFASEKVTAYELGYRVQPVDIVSLSLAGFYNQYSDLRSIDVNPSGPQPYVFANGQRGRAHGVELSGTVAPTAWWRLRGGYTALAKRLRATVPRVVRGSDMFEGNDPDHQFLVQSTMDLPGHTEFDVITWQQGSLPAPGLRSYLTADARLAWQYRRVELAVVGHDLGNVRQPELFGPFAIPRSVYGRVTLRM